MDLIWNGIIEHIAQHGLSQDDVQYLFEKPTRYGVNRLTGEPAVFGDTPDGRYIIVVYLEIDRLCLPCHRVRITGVNPVRKKARKLTPAEQARIARAGQAADRPDRADLIQQAQAAQKQAALDDVMATLKAARESAGISLRDLEESTGI